MFKHIVLASDGSETASQAAKKAIELAKIHGAKLTAAFVVDPYPFIGVGEDSGAGLQAYTAAAQANTTRAVAAFEAFAKEAGVQANARVVESSQVAKGILMVADEVGADLVVVGSHGKSGIQKLVLGSVSSKVVASCEVPVLVVR